MNQNAGADIPPGAAVGSLGFPALVTAEYQTVLWTLFRSGQTSLEAEAHSTRATIQTLIPQKHSVDVVSSFSPFGSSSSELLFGPRENIESLLRPLPRPP